MSAILPFHEEPVGDPQGRRWLHMYLNGDVPRLFGMPASPSMRRPPLMTAAGVRDPELDEATLGRSNAELLRVVYQRGAISDRLAGRVISVQLGRSDGSDPCRVYLSLEEPLPLNIVPWSHMGKSLRNISMLSTTGKMACPSFSLPAGPPAAGGSCPAARWTCSPGADRLPPGVKEISGVDADPGASVCQQCYAVIGNYAQSSIQAALAIRYLWTKQALQQPAGDSRFSNSFVETLVAAIEGENFDSCREPDQQRYFRIHDSGDFFSADYFRAWKEIADHFYSAKPRVWFWAPTRMWAVPKWVDLVNEVNAKPRNLTIRPSEYYLEEDPITKLGPGWAAGTCVFRKRSIPEAIAQGRFDWNCEAYSTLSDRHTCVEAIAPNRKGEPTDTIGCRACWRNGNLSVNYTFH